MKIHKDKSKWVETFLKTRNQKKAAEELGVPRSTFSLYLSSIPNLNLTPYSKDDLEFWINLYCSNFGMLDIERYTGRSRATLRIYLKRFGVYEVPMNLERDYGEAISNLNSNGMSAEDIAKELDISKAGVHKILYKRNEHRNLRETLLLKIDYRDKLFDNMNNQFKNYWLGFIVADGHFSKTGLKIEISVKDFIHLKTFADFIKRKIIHFERTRKNGETSKMIRLEFASWYMSDSIKKYQLLGNKAHNKKLSEVFDYIPKKYINHFVRGYFDGDGTLGLYWQKKQNKWKRAVSFTGNYNFISKLNEVIAEELRIKLKKIFRLKAAEFSAQLSFQGKGDIEKLIYWMYDDTEFLLERKMYRAEALLSNIYS